MKTDGETLSKTTLENSKFFMRKEPRADAGTRMHAHHAQRREDLYLLQVHQFLSPRGNWRNLSTTPKGLALFQNRKPLV